MRTPDTKPGARGNGRSLGSECRENSRPSLETQLRRHRLAEHLHALGSRPLLHALEEVAAGADLDQVLAAYGRLPVDVVKALGGDRFPVTLHEIAA